MLLLCQEFSDHISCTYPGLWGECIALGGYTLGHVYMHIYNQIRWHSGKKNPQQEMQENWLQSLGQEDPLEWEMAAHPNILAWRIPRTEEPGGLHRVTNSQTRLSTAHIRTYVQARIIDQKEI